MVRDYDPTQERRLRLRIPEFELVSKKAGHSWKLVELTDSFAKWMSQHEYRDAYFEQPEDMELACKIFAEAVANEVRTALQAEDVDANTIVAIVGLASLFGLTRASLLFEM